MFQGRGLRRSPRFVLFSAVVQACAVDAADKALLPATFKAMEEELKARAVAIK